MPSSIHRAAGWDTESYDSAQSQYSGSTLLLAPNGDHNRHATPSSPGGQSHSTERSKFSLRAFTSAIKASSNPPTPMSGHSHLPSPPSSPTLPTPSRRRTPPPPIATLPPSHFLHPSPHPRTPCPLPASPSPRKLASKSSQLSLSLSSSELGSQPGGLRGKAARVLGEEILPSGKAAKVMGVTISKEVGGVGRKVEHQMSRERREIVEKLTPTPISRSRSPAPPPLWLPLPPPSSISSPAVTGPARSCEKAKNAALSTSQALVSSQPPPSDVLTSFPLPHNRSLSPAPSPRRFSSTADTSSPPPSASSLSPTSPQVSSPDSHDAHRSSDVDPALSLDRLFSGRSPVGLSHQSFMSSDSSACGLEGLEFTTSGLSSEVSSPNDEQAGDLPTSPRLSYFSYVSRSESASGLPAVGPASPPPPVPTRTEPTVDRKTGFPSFLSHSLRRADALSPPPLPIRSSSRPPTLPLARSGTMMSVASARTRGVQRGNALEALEGRRKIEVPPKGKTGRRDRSDVVVEKGKTTISKPAAKSTPILKPTLPPPPAQGKSFIDWSDDDEGPPTTLAPVSAAARRPVLASHFSSSSTVVPASRPKEDFEVRQTLSSPLDPFFSHHRTPAPPLPAPQPTAYPQPPSLARATSPPAPLATKSLVSRPPPKDGPIEFSLPPTRLPASDSVPSLPSLSSSSTLESTASSSGGAERGNRERRKEHGQAANGSVRKHRHRPSLDSGFRWLDGSSD